MVRTLGVLCVLLSACPALASKALKYSALEAAVATAQRDDSVEVAVSLHLMRSLFDKNTRCFAPSDGLVVTLDGVPMTRTVIGGPAKPTQISGVAMLPNGCAPPTWRLVTKARTPRSTIEFTLNGGTGRLVVEHLLSRRVLAVPKGAVIKAGAPMAVRWMPASDRWPGSNVDVTIYRPDHFSKRAHGEYVDGEIRFTLPAVPPGPARIDVRPQRPVQPTVAECGLGRCTIGAVTSWPVDVTIAP